MGLWGLLLLLSSGWRWDDATLAARAPGKCKHEWICVHPRVASVVAVVMGMGRRDARRTCAMKRWRPWFAAPAVVFLALLFLVGAAWLCEYYPWEVDK